MIVLESPTKSEPRWEFARKSPNTPQSEPISGELFTASSADKLVREVIQNSLDAVPKDQPSVAVEVRVRFTFPEEAISLEPDSPWLKGLIPHLQADGNGLAKRHDIGSNMSILLIEDYGTCGLTGSALQTNDKEPRWRGLPNNFFYFWRAEGTTGKGDGQKGSWGIGKTVLPASSGIQTFLGVSCEGKEGPSRLFGRSIIKHHMIAGESDVFTPYGYFGNYETTDSIAMPVDDLDTVTQFCRDFGITREGEPGLSLVILDPNLLDFSGKTLIASSVVNYFFPILEEQLVVEVVEGDKITVIDASTIVSHVKEIRPELLKKHGIETTTMLDALSLAQWSIEQRRGAAIKLNFPSDSLNPRWNETIFEVDKLDDVETRFAEGDAVEFIVPVKVVPNNEPEQEAEFFVSLKKIHREQSPKTFYLRDGITIGEPKDRGEKGIVAFAVVEKGPLANLLKQSEDPSHTKWLERGARLGEHYKNPKLVSFVKDSVAAIHDRLTRVNEGIDADLLADLFYLEEHANDALEKSGEGGRGTNPQKARVPKNLKANPQPAQVTVRENDIVISGVPDVAKEQQIIVVHFAYDVRRGNAFTKWSKYDFDLFELKNRMEFNGAIRLEATGNVLEFAVEQADFEVRLSGFDPERDVLVDVKLKYNP